MVSHSTAPMAMNTRKMFLPKTVTRMMMKKMRGS